MFTQLISTMVLVFVLFVCIFVLSSGNPLYLLGLFLLPLAAWVAAHVQTLALLGLALYYANLAPPFFPIALSLSNVCAMLFAGMMFVRILHSGRSRRLRAADRLVLAYLALLLVLIVSRGSGFRVLGSDKWGGSYYVAHFVAIGFFLFSDRVQVSVAACRNAFLAMLVLSFLRPAAEALFMFSGGSHTWQFMVVRPETSGMLMGLSGLQGGTFRIFRFHALMIPSVCAVLYAIYCYLHNRGLLRIGLVLLLAGFMAVFTGYRLSILHILSLVFLGILLGDKSRRIKYLVVGASAAVMFYAIAVLMAPRLPLAAQRILSILPGVSVSELAVVSAEATVKWRFELWSHVLRQLPEYLWIGRGIVFSRIEFEMLNTQTNLSNDNILYQYWTHQYHHGPLAILIDFGLPGALICFSWLFLALREVGRNLKALAPSHVLRPVAGALLCMLSANIFLFFLSFGDTRSMISFLYQAAFLRITFATARDAEPGLKEAT